jgi:hypothetical protein
MPELDNQRQADEELIGMAWFFAGEGYINISIPNADKPFYPSLRVAIATTEKLWADLFHSRFGGFTWVQKPTKQNHKFVFGWRVTGKEAEAFLETIKPHLKGEKLAQLEHALRFRNDTKRFYRKGGKINTQTELWAQYRTEMKNIRLAAAETNRKDAELTLRCDSPNLEAIPVT